VVGVVLDNGAMPGMKITISAAMRARDVSRPRPEQLAEAEVEVEAETEVGAEAGAETEVGAEVGEADVAIGGSGAAAGGVDPVTGVRPSDRFGGRAGRQHGTRRRRRGSG
jgi:hypothetical protein